MPAITHGQVESTTHAIKTTTLQTIDKVTTHNYMRFHSFWLAKHSVLQRSKICEDEVIYCINFPFLSVLCISNILYPKYPSISTRLTKRGTPACPIDPGSRFLRSRSLFSFPIDWASSIPTQIRRKGQVVRWQEKEKENTLTFSCNATKTPRASKCVWCLVYNVKGSQQECFTTIWSSPQVADIEQRQLVL